MHRVDGLSGVGLRLPGQSLCGITGRRDARQEHEAAPTTLAMISLEPICMLSAVFRLVRRCTAQTRGIRSASPMPHPGLKYARRYASEAVNPTILYPPST